MQDKQEHFQLTVAKLLKFIILGGLIFGILGLLTGYLIGHSIKLAGAGFLVGMLAGEFAYAISESSKKGV